MPLQRWTSLDAELLRVLLVVTFWGRASGVACSATEPSLDRSACGNVTAQSGLTAFLHCHVPQQADGTVSWIRRRDFHILTSGLMTYTNDERFRVFHRDGSDDWVLQVKFVDPSDEGVYECQVSTEKGLLSYLAYLKVIVPEAVILGSPEYHVEKSSTFTLVCVIEKAFSPPPVLLWYHDEQLLNYDLSRSRVFLRAESAPRMLSRLTVKNVVVSDSGNYTCRAPNVRESSVAVYVSEGDKMAAIHELSPARRAGPSMLLAAVFCPVLLLLNT